jgi:ribosomal protein S18 acetylase RimI-like enzyme
MIEKLDKVDVVFNNVSSKERRDLISNKLIDFNKAQSPKVHQCYKLESDSPTFIEIYAEVEPDKLVGGLISYIDWGCWLYIDTIWIDTNYRKQGIGKKLVTSAEQKAKDNDIKRVRLCTFDFQALSFYQKLGYTVYGKLEDYPEGHTLYYLKKILF